GVRYCGGLASYRLAAESGMDSERAGDGSACADVWCQGRDKGRCLDEYYAGEYRRVGLYIKRSAYWRNKNTYRWTKCLFIGWSRRVCYRASVILWLASCPHPI